MKAGVFTFGDPLPSGSDDDTFVSYSIVGFPGGMLSGPYTSRTYAESELDDIRGYEGVYNVKIVTRSELQRTEFYPFTEAS